MRNYLKKITTSLLILCATTTLLAQAPQKMSYQSVIRNTGGALVTNTAVGIKTSVLQGSATGTAVYVETQTTTTNANGLASIAIGGGTPVTGTFAGINWSTGTYFIKTETDPTGGTSYTISGTSQLLSVPYALYSGSSQNQGKPSIILIGNMTNAQAAAQIAAEFGPHTENICIRNTTGLTMVDLSAITNLITLTISDNVNLTTVNLNGLTKVFGNISIKDNTTLSTLSFPALTKMYGESEIENNTALTSISLPVLTDISDKFSLRNNALTTFSCPVLTKASDFYIESNTALNSISFLALNNANYLYIAGNTNLASLSLPVVATLSSIGNGISILDSKLTSINLPSLTSSSVSIAQNPLLTSVGLPLLTNSSAIAIQDNTVITSINFPVLTNCSQIIVQGNPSLTAVGIPSLTTMNGIYSSPNLSLNNNALPSSKINLILNKMLTVTPSTGKNIDLSNQTPAAPPTGQGITDKTTLNNAGNNVTTD